MNKNMRFVIVAIIIAILIAMFMAPKKDGSEAPATASPANGMMDDAATAADNMMKDAGEAMDDAATATGEAMDDAGKAITDTAEDAAEAVEGAVGEVDGVPSGAEVTGDAAAPATTTPAPEETTAPAAN